jgi:hypothetical protein
MIATFSLWRIVATLGALRALESANQSAVIFLARHCGTRLGRTRSTDRAVLSLCPDT